MAPKRVPKGAMEQDRVFYDKHWSKEIDHVFIGALVEQSFLGNFAPGRQNSHAILIAMGVVNRQFGVTFDYPYCVGRVKKLHKRYKVFNWIIHSSGVVYNPLSKTVECDELTWEFICREQKLAMAYMVKGETEFDALKCFFQEGPDSESESEAAEVIVISSDQENTEKNKNTIDVGDQFANGCSEENTDNSFWNEMAWYSLDNSESEESLPCAEPSTRMSATTDAKFPLKQLQNKVGNSARAPSGETPSSTASNSSFKRH